MNLHEYQSKSLLKSYDVPTPSGTLIEDVGELNEFAQNLTEDTPLVVKAQIHSGGRGKAGGVKVVQTKSELLETGKALLGSTLVTYQTGEAGLPVNQLLLEPVSQIQQEFYLSALVDRTREAVVFVISAEGGMEIETVAEKHPEKILTIVVNPIVGLQGYQTRQAAFFLGLTGNSIKQLGKIMQGIHRLFVAKDAALVEVNPLIVTEEGDLLALDAKVSLDENAAYRQAALFSLRDEAQENATEVKARQFNLNYISLEGEIGCMVNGAGLAMATMDIIKLHGGSPANFLDVGGGTTAERVTEAFKLLLETGQVKAVLVNIFGGIVRCDLIAEGIITAIKEVGVDVPVIVRLEGTKSVEGRALLEKSGLDVIAENDLELAAKAAVAQARGDV